MIKDMKKYKRDWQRRKYHKNKKFREEKIISVIKYQRSSKRYQRYKKVYQNSPERRRYMKNYMWEYLQDPEHREKQYARNREYQRRRRSRHGQGMGNEI